MSSFLALTLKSSKKSAFLWKGVLDPRKHMWRDVKISKDMHVSSQDMALAYDSPLFGKVCPLGCSEKVCIFSPFLRLCQKLQEGGRRSKDLIPTTITLCWYFLFFSLLHEDGFFGFVLVSRWVQVHNIHGIIMFLLVIRNFLPLCPVQPQDLWRWSLGWIRQCPSVGGGAQPRHPCRLLSDFFLYYDFLRKLQ